MMNILTQKIFNAKISANCTILKCTDSWYKLFAFGFTLMFHVGVSIWFEWIFFMLSTPGTSSEMIKIAAEPKMPIRPIFFQP